MKSAIITGITGQDGAYLAELLLEKGYKVYGTYRRTSSTNFWRIDELGLRDTPNMHLVEYDLTDIGSSIRLLELAQPDEIYNLAAQSFVAVSFDQHVTTDLPYLLMYTATNKYQPGWLASQADMLAEDWEVVTYDHPELEGGKSR